MNTDREERRTWKHVTMRPRRSLVFIVWYAWRWTKVEVVNSDLKKLPKSADEKIPIASVE